MRQEDASLVRDLPLFMEANETTFQTLLQASFLQRFPTQVELISEDQPADFFYVVLEGCIELYAIAGTKQSTATILRPVSSFAAAAVLRDGNYLLSARTLEPSRVLMIPGESVRAAFASDHAFAIAFALELATAYRRTMKALNNQKLRTAIERLANYLLQEHRIQGATGNLTLPTEKQTLASLLGMTSENLSRSFGALAAQGVKVTGREIQLSDISSLEAIAKPIALIDDPAY